MKPNFALILDQDGIVLLHRSKNGWRVVGQADPASAQLSNEMQYLRRSATALAGGQFATKLVVPNSQILYQSLVLPDAVGDRSVQVREALDGLTPYGVDELAFDWYELEGGSVVVAAVAEQTLQEAEQFADQHRFNPISFVAIPEPEEFAQEPFFGATSGARRLLNPGGVVERDSSPIDMQAVLAALESESELVQPADDTPIFLVESATTVLADTSPDAAHGDHAEHDKNATEDEIQPEVQDVAPSSDTASEEEDTAETSPEQPEPSAGESGEDPATDVADTAGETGADVDTVPQPVVAFSSRRTALPPEPEPATDAPELESIAARFSPRDKKSEPDDVPEPTPVAATEEKSPETTPVGPTVADAVGAIKRRTTSAPVVSAPVARPARPAEIRPAKTFGGLALLLAIAALAAVGLASATAYMLLGEPDNELVGSGLFDTIPAALPDSVAINDTGQSVSNLSGSTPQSSLETTGQTDLQATAPSQPNADRDADLDDLFGIDAPEVTLSGIRQLAPVSPTAPSSDRIDDLYLASIDRVIVAHDAVALPTPGTLSPDPGLARQTPPPAFGSQFAFDDQGLVEPTPEGTLSPDGILVFLGSPAIVPIPRPGSGEVVAADGLSAERRRELAAFTPVPRPGTLAETDERSRLAGLSRNELASFKPVPRPVAAEAQPEPEVVPGEPTERAVAASLVPVARPKGLAETARQAAVQAVRPPPPPAGATVAQAATIQNGLRLNQVNLVGVYGSSSSRRALVRMPGGRFVMVTVGDRLDGGRVAAISTDSLVYTKRGRNVTLEVPNG